VRATSDVDTGQLEHPLGGRLEDRFEFRFCGGEMLAATGQRLLLGAVGQKAVMANPHESVGKHMLEKPLDEFTGWQDRDLATIAVGPIALNVSIVYDGQARLLGVTVCRIKEVTNGIS